MIAQEDLALFRFAETAEAVWQCLLDQGLRPTRRSGPTAGGPADRV